MPASLRVTTTILAIFATGLLAGLMLGTGMDQYTHRALPEAAWTLEHQTMDVLFRRVMPPFFNLAALLMIGAAVLNRGAARFLFAIAAVLLLFSILITVTVEVPINRAVEHWIPGAAPADWAQIRDRWLWNHLRRTSAGVVALLCSITGLALQKTNAT